MIRPSLTLMAGLALLTASAGIASAQTYPSINGRQYPLSQSTPPGVAGQWANQLGRGVPAYFQPVRVSLPTSGKVTWYDQSVRRPMTFAAPAQADMLVGPVYRLRITEVPELPGQEFYPTIEVVDRLHPPAGHEQKFPVDVELTLEELEWAAQGRMITKVVYLEQPDAIPTRLVDANPRIIDLPPSQNAVAEADALGRPIAIVRIGGRTPDPHYPEDPAFFGECPPVRVGAAAVDVASRQSVDPRTGLEARPAAYPRQAASAGSGLETPVSGLNRRE